MTKHSNHSSELTSYGVDLVGTYPPPIGGVSVHIKRLQQELHFLGIHCLVYDIGATEYKNSWVMPISNAKKWLLSRVFFGSGESIVHYHRSNWKYLALLSIILQLSSSKLVCTLHSLRDEWETSSFTTKLCIRIALNSVDHFIVVAPHIFDKLSSWGVDHRKVSVIPAFIPPRPIQSDYDGIPNYIWEFIEKHSPIITANAFKISFHKDEDLYGIDMCIKLCADLQPDFPNLGFVFCLPDIGDEQYFEKMKLELNQRGLNEHFLFVNETIEYYPILSRSDLFIRPTNTDGDAISIREALSLGIPVICSDIVSRPEVTIRFKTRNSTDLFKKSQHFLLSQLTQQKSARTNLDNNQSQVDNLQKILDVYAKLTNSSNDLGTISTSKSDLTRQDFA